MKILTNRQPVNGPYGGGNHFVKAFLNSIEKSSDHKLIASDSMNEPPDVALMIGLDAEGSNLSVEQAIMYTFVHDVKLILRVNECDARKNTNHVDKRLVEASKHINGAVFVSEWLKGYFMERGWQCKKNTVIRNGVDSEVFAPAQQKEASEKTRIITAHWSDNVMKGEEYHKFIDEFVGKHSSDFTYTYVGRSQYKFKNATHVPPLSGKKLGEEVAKHDVCINATKFDPGPNSVIEPIACGLPTYVHKDGGGAVEFAGKNHVFKDTGELEKLLLSRKFVKNTFKPDAWETCIDRYLSFMGAL